jgi:hypothetical protein
MEKKVTRILDHHLITSGGLQISFERTLRIPDDGNVYPLPPSLGSFPIYNVEDFFDKVPEEWREKGGYFIPMYQREAMWLNFSGSINAMVINAGNINAITGKDTSETLDGEVQNYIVAPSQPWLDGFNVGDGYIRQFVAMPLGQGYSVEEQLSKEKAAGGVSFIIYSAKPGLIPEEDEELNYSKFSECMVMESIMEDSMSLAAGGKMKQEIYPDEYGIDTWDLDNRVEINIHIANSEMFEKITGTLPPSSPITAEEYNEYGYPWFDLYNEGKGDIPASELFGTVKSIKEIDEEKDLRHEDPSIKIHDHQIVTLKKG